MDNGMAYRTKAGERVAKFFGALLDRGSSVLNLGLVVSGAIAVGIIVGYVGAHDYLKPTWEIAAARDAEKQFERLAVRVGAAKWDNDSEGAPRFRWMRCSALGVPR